MGIEKVNYIEVLKEENLSELDSTPAKCRIFLSITIDGVRLIDNMAMRKGLVKKEGLIRAVEKKSGLDEARDESISNSYRAFTKAFPSARVETKCEAGAEVSCRELYNRWDSIVEGGACVTVPISWDKKIYQEGISVVQAGDGARFILDSKERKIKRLNEEYIRCWAVRAVKRKHKICTVENAILMKYDAGGDVVLSISDNWAKSESLIRRRIKDSTLDVLMAL